MSDLERVDVDTFKELEKNAFCIVLDNIRSMNNVGSVFRTADAFLAEKIYLCGITATPPHRDIEKTALGATESVSWEYAKDTTSLVRQLQETGWIVLAVEQVKKSTKLHEFQPISGTKYAFILGNEVFGVSDEVMEVVNDALEIPQFGTKHSLNISVTTGIICWDFVSKTRLLSSNTH